MAAFTSPSPMAAPTKAEIADPMHIGITYTIYITLNEITIAA
jgi:hypothetical protein